jgi:hypothetical protein
MMSLINTNYSYLQTMRMKKESPIVGIIVSVYYLGCTLGAVIASWLADKKGRKTSIFTCLATTSLGNLLMFISGLSTNGSSPWNGGALACMLGGRVVMGLGVGGIDAVIPVYSSELSSDGARGRALAQEFQMNIFGLLMAYSINLGVTLGLGEESQWAWRTPILVMQIYPILLMSFISRLPESPRWFISKERKNDAKKALETIYDKGDAKSKLDELQEAQDNESGKKVRYEDMLLPGGSQFHPVSINPSCSRICSLSQIEDVSFNSRSYSLVKRCTNLSTVNDHSHGSSKPSTDWLRCCLRVRPSDLRAPWLRNQKSGIPHPRKLYFLFLNDDFRMAIYRRSRTTQTHGLGCHWLIDLLRYTHHFRRLSTKCPQPPWPCCRNPRKYYPLRRYGNFWYRLASHRLAYSHRNLP